MTLSYLTPRTHRLLVTASFLILANAFGEWNLLQAQQTEPNTYSQVDSPAYYLRSPVRSLMQNRQLLDNLGLKISLTLGYNKGEQDEVPWKTQGMPGIKAAHYFIRPLADGAYRTVELALSVRPQGGYEVVVYGLETDPPEEYLNPDLPGIQTTLQDMITNIQQEPPSLDFRQLSHMVYQLSYVHADRALALLKVMGYTTVEYTKEIGEGLNDKIYTPSMLGEDLPVVVKLIDSPKTSLLDPEPMEGFAAPPPQQYQQQAGFGSSAISTVPDIGGTFLHQMTSGEPQQRLLMIYEEEDPEPLRKLLQFLREKIDVPARQILIEALVIEINNDRLRDLGVSLQTNQSRSDFEFGQPNTQTDGILPFIFSFDRNRPSFGSFKAKLKALLETGDAELLSNPSVLTLDGRQAKIQIAQQVPVIRATSTAAATFSSVEYFPVGIVLNLRPRISEDGSQITMQTEAIVSAVNQLATDQLAGASQVFQAPVVDNRQVQTFVRVANNTPFIIGGLIASEQERRTTGIPLLSQIPGIGFLFRRTSTSETKQEVIIVVTPHVVPADADSFSYVLPKDSDVFDRLDYRLFRNSYRIRGADVFDLKFVFDSDIFQDVLSRTEVVSKSEYRSTLTEPLLSVLQGGVPSEDILVRRMLWEIIDKTGFYEHIELDRIIFFEDRPDAPDGSGFQLAFLNEKLANIQDGQNTLALSYEAQPKGTQEHPLVQPKAVLNYANLTAEKYQVRLTADNSRNPDGSPRNWAILLTDAYSGIRVSPLDLLRGVLILKRVMELNSSMPLTLKEFHVGRDIIFPSKEDLSQGYHIIDRDAARLFYEVINYYSAFEQEFNHQIQHMIETLEQIE